MYMLPYILLPTRCTVSEPIYVHSSALRSLQPRDIYRHSVTVYYVVLVTSATPLHLKSSVAKIFGSVLIE